MRVALEVVAVLEGAGLAFVDIDGHQPRRRLRAHDAPLAPRRKPGAAQAAQAGSPAPASTVFDRRSPLDAFREPSDSRRPAVGGESM